MPKEQYTKWFSDERKQITDERKQKLIEKYQQQQQSIKKVSSTTTHSRQQVDKKKIPIKQSLAKSVLKSEIEGSDVSLI